MNTINKKERSNLYLNADIKKKAKEILSRCGLSLSDAMNVLLTQVILEKGIPFRIHIPNETTQKVMDEVREKKNLEEIPLNSLVSEAKRSAEP